VDARRGELPHARCGPVRGPLVPREGRPHARCRSHGL